MSRDDFHQSYNNCIGKLTDTENYDDVMLFYLSEVIGHHRGHVYIEGSVTDPKDKANDTWNPKRIAVTKDSVHLDFTWPNMGLINFNKACVRATQRPVRQYRRGYNIRCIRTTNIAELEQEYLGRRPFSNNDLRRPRVVKELFYPSYIPADRAYNTIINGERIAAAVTDKIFNQLMLGSDQVYLGYKSIIVGVVENRPQEGLIAHLFKGNDFLMEQISQVYNMGDFV